MLLKYFVKFPVRHSISCEQSSHFHGEKDRNLCIVRRFLCTVHRKFLPIFRKTLNAHLELRTKILAHFKGSDAEITVLQFHSLLEIIMMKL